MVKRGPKKREKKLWKALPNHNHDQDDIDEMRAEEQAQQAEAQITMFELLRLRYFFKHELIPEYLHKNPEYIKLRTVGVSPPPMRTLTQSQNKIL